MTEKQKNEYYDALQNGQQPVVIGSAFVRNEWKDVELIEESNVNELQRVRVIWRDEKNRRVTSFVAPSSIKHCL